MKLDLICTGKNERLEGTVAVADISFTQTNTNPVAYSTGAVIGTPNAPVFNTENLQSATAVLYNLNGSLSFTIRDEKEIEKYKVGKTYQLSLDFEAADTKPASK